MSQSCPACSSSRTGLDGFRRLYDHVKANHEEEPTALEKMQIRGAIRAASMGVYLEPTAPWMDQFEHCVRRNFGIGEEVGGGSNGD